MLRTMAQAFALVMRRSDITSAAAFFMVMFSQPGLSQSLSGELEAAFFECTGLQVSSVAGEAGFFDGAISSLPAPRFTSSEDGIAAAQCLSNNTGHLGLMIEEEAALGPA